MTSADRVRLFDEVEAIRDELVALQERFADVMREVRDLAGGDWLYERVDAYPGIRLDRDMGAGQNAEDWISDVGALLERGEGEGRSYRHASRRAPGASPGPSSVRSDQVASGALGDAWTTLDVRGTIPTSVRGGRRVPRAAGWQAPGIGGASGRWP